LWGWASMANTSQSRYIEKKKPQTEEESEKETVGGVLNIEPKKRAMGGKVGKKRGGVGGGDGRKGRVVQRGEVQKSHGCGGKRGKGQKPDLEGEGSEKYYQKVVYSGVSKNGHCNGEV